MPIFCEEPNLVAYAPYDMPENFKMYRPGSLPLTYSSGGYIQFSWANSVSGVIIGPSSGFLKYDLGSLDLGSNFSIEMSVKGSALKRASGTYFLYKIWNIYLNQDTYNGNTRLKTGYSDTPISGFHDLEEIPLNSLDNNELSILDSSKFYRVVVKYDNTRPKIYIYDWNIQILVSNNLNSSNIPSWTLINLFIWSQSSMLRQWNDIIDSVKIYMN